MTPRTAHLTILSLLCFAPAAAGVFLAIKGDRSHSDLSGIAVAAGIALMGGSVLYALVSSALVWKLGTTPARVLGVHAGIFGVAATLFVGSRILFLVSS